MASSLIGIDVGNDSCKLAVRDGGQIRFISGQLPDNLVTDGEIVSLQTLGEFIQGVIGLFFAFAEMLLQQHEDQIDAELAEKIKDGTGFDAALERTRAPVFPFGPSIALACWVTMLVGAQVLRWYTGLF